VTQIEKNADTFDYVIVGGGTAGSLLAARLSEEPSISVCVLEAGPADLHPWIHVPAGFIKILANPAYTWRFDSEPSPGTAGRRIPATQGKTLGGSSSINGMIYNRCQHSDYDQWALRGNRGWSHQDVLPYFKRSERRAGGDDFFRGRTGELQVTDSDWRHPICDAFIDGAARLGIPRNPDYNGQFQEGVGYMQRYIYRGRRQSASQAFLRPAKRRANLHIRTHCLVKRVLTEQRRATGVEFSRMGDETSTVFARREVILCAGTINTARLLQLSGIGPAKYLQSVGVPVVHDLPGVGENLQDHFCVRIVARVKNAVTINEKSRGIRLASEIVKWTVGRPSILALSPSVVHFFGKSDPTLSAPDFQGVFTPASYKNGIVADLDTFPGMTLGIYPQRPASTGFVRIGSPNAAEAPIIQPNYLGCQADREVIVNALRAGRRVLASDALKDFLVAETQPGPAAQSDEALLDFARHFGSTVYHFVGTARMGPASDPLAVVDDQLRVHAMAGLRVVDASIMPSIPSGNTCVPVMMIAEKAADMILGRPPLACQPSQGVPLA
jgi:choline dehydrogenase